MMLSWLVLIIVLTHQSVKGLNIHTYEGDKHDSEALHKYKERGYPQSVEKQDLNGKVDKDIHSGNWNNKETIPMKEGPSRRKRLGVDRNEMGQKLQSDYISHQRHTQNDLQESRINTTSACKFKDELRRCAYPLDSLILGVNVQSSSWKDALGLKTFPVHVLEDVCREYANFERGVNILPKKDIKLYRMIL